MSWLDDRELTDEKLLKRELRQVSYKSVKRLFRLWYKYSRRVHSHARVRGGNLIAKKRTKVPSILQSNNNSNDDLKNKITMKNKNTLTITNNNNNNTLSSTMKTNDRKLRFSVMEKEEGEYVDISNTSSPYTSSKLSDLSETYRSNDFSRLNMHMSDGMYLEGSIEFSKRRLFRKWQNHCSIRQKSLSKSEQVIAKLTRKETDREIINEALNRRRPYNKRKQQQQQHKSYFEEPSFTSSQPLAHNGMSFFTSHAKQTNHSILLKAWKCWHREFRISNHYIRHHKLKGMRRIHLICTSYFKQKQNLRMAMTHHKVFLLQQALKIFKIVLSKTFKQSFRTSKIHFKNSFNEIRGKIPRSSQQNLLFCQTKYLFKLWLGNAGYLKYWRNKIKIIHLQRKRRIFHFLRMVYGHSYVMKIRLKYLLRNWKFYYVSQHHIRLIKQHWFLKVLKRCQYSNNKLMRLQSNITKNMMRRYFFLINETYNNLKTCKIHILSQSLLKIKQHCHKSKNSRLVLYSAVINYKLLYFLKWINITKQKLKQYKKYHNNFITIRNINLMKLFNILKTRLLKMSKMDRNRLEFAIIQRKKFLCNSFFKLMKYIKTNKINKSIQFKEILLNNIMNDNLKRYLLMHFTKIYPNKYDMESMNDTHGSSSSSNILKLFDVIFYRNRMRSSFYHFLTHCKRIKLMKPKYRKEILIRSFETFSNQLILKRVKKNTYKESILYTNRYKMKKFLEMWKKRTLRRSYSQNSSYQGQFYYQFRLKYFALIALKV